MQNRNRDEGLYYTEWWDKDDNIEERLLFDHRTDPDENYNVVDRQEYAKTAKKLSKLLKKRRGPEFDKYGPEYTITYNSKKKRISAFEF